MAALGDARRAGGSSMEQQRRDSGNARAKERRDIGANNEAGRRAIGDELESSRRGASQMVDDLNRLVVPTSAPRTLRKLEPRGAVPATRGTANNAPVPVRQTGGIASPLTEPSYAAREFWAGSYIESSDGMLTLQIEPLKKLVLRDANNAEVVFDLAEPIEPEAP